MSDWKIQKNAGACVRCQGKFDVSHRFFSVLFDKPEGLLREDYCQACFSGGRPQGFFSFWRTVLPEPDAPKRPVVDIESVFDVFRNMRAPQEPSAARFRYLIALMLMRKKRLRLNRITRKGGRELLVLVEPRVGAEHEVESMNLTPEEMQELSGKLGAWMGAPMELPAITGGSAPAPVGEAAQNGQQESPGAQTGGEGR